jgi:predicted lipoprotein
LEQTKGFLLMNFSYFSSLKAGVLFSSIILTACGGGGSSDSNSGNDNLNSLAGTEAQRATLRAIGENVVIPVYQSVQTEVNTLTTALDTYCSDLENNSANSTASRSIAQASWQDSMSQWQRAEAFQFGPVADGGVDSIRNHIYSWPAVSACFIDGGVVSYEDDPDAFDIAEQSPRRLGLDGVEYLLFSDTLNHSCSTDSSTDNADNISWNNRTDEERKLARCKYASVLADDVNTQITTLLNAWLQEGDNYLTQLSTAGKGSSRYDSVKDALKDISDSLFYLDTDVKDNKIAIPAGLSRECSKVSCPDSVESTVANYSIESVKSNLQGFLAIIEGGLDDLLAEVGQETITNTMVADLNAALTQIDLFPGTLQSAVTGINESDCINTTSTNRIEPACALHADVKKVTDKLKADFVLALSLSVPTEAEGDND